MPTMVAAKIMSKRGRGRPVPHVAKTKLPGVRQSHGHTQDDLVQLAGVSRRSIARIEAGGASRAVADTLARIAAVYEMSVSELFPEVTLHATPPRKRVS